MVGANIQSFIGYTVLFDWKVITQNNPAKNRGGFLYNRVFCALFFLMMLIFSVVRSYKSRTFLYGWFLLRTKGLFVQIRARSTVLCKNRAVCNSLIFNVINIEFCAFVQKYKIIIAFVSSLFCKEKNNKKRIYYMSLSGFDCSMHTCSKCFWKNEGVEGERTAKKKASEAQGTPMPEGYYRKPKENTPACTNANHPDRILVLSSRIRVVAP